MRIRLSDKLVSFAFAALPLALPLAVFPLLAAFPLLLDLLVVLAVLEVFDWGMRANGLQLRQIDHSQTDKSVLVRVQHFFMVSHRA